MFDSQVLPAIQARRTRASYFTNWRAFVTYAHLHGCLDQVVPASPTIIKGYLWFLLQAGYRPGTITLRLYSIIDRHLRFKLPFPYHQKEIKAWTKAFERLCGVPRRDKLAITSTHLKAILSSPRSSLRCLRDSAIVALGTVCALRVSEILELDVCDLLFDFEPGTLAVRVKKRKNDQKRAGLWPRVGRALNRQFDIISLCQTWLSRSGLRVHDMCEKAKHPRSSCRTCGRLFTRLSGCGSKIFPVGHNMHGATTHTVRDAVFSQLSLAGFPAAEFSGISMRRGGLTTAIADGVPSSLYELQSGHASDAWKHYVRPGQTDQLLRFFQAFKL
jgi:integrase